MLHISPPGMAKAVVSTCIVLLMSSLLVESGDDNRIYSPCSDATVASGDGITIGIAFANEKDFSVDIAGRGKVQLSPCDRRLSLSQIALFRPKVDEISLLTINTSSFFPADSAGFMVAFAGKKYAARSRPIQVADNNHIVTGFTLVLEFKKGRLENLFWKRDGCGKCSRGNSRVTCINNQYCATNTQICKNRGGQEDCNIGIQLASSGTDKHYKALNSWYEVQNLRQYSLFSLYTNLRKSIPFGALRS